MENSSQGNVHGRVKERGMVLLTYNETSQIIDVLVLLKIVK